MTIVQNLYILDNRSFGKATWSCPNFTFRNLQDDRTHFNDPNVHNSFPCIKNWIGSFPLVVSASKTGLQPRTPAEEAMDEAGVFFEGTFGMAFFS